MTSEIVQPAGGLDEGVLKALLEVAANVTDAAEELDSGDAVFDAHAHLGDAPVGLPPLRGQSAPPWAFSSAARP